MALRPLYLPLDTEDCLVRTIAVQFEWFPGMSMPQKRKSIASLHSAALKVEGVERVLEVSSKSPNPLGVALSAFNLTLQRPDHRRSLSVECAFQGSKVFLNAGPFTDLYEVMPREAKRDLRLRTSGQLKGFRFMERDWDLEPQTAFYDWLYINALSARRDLADQLASFSAFTDIEFNPAKSINCQAYSVALFVSLERSGQLNEATSSAGSFLSLLSSKVLRNARQNDAVQPRLF